MHVDEDSHGHGKRHHAQPLRCTFAPDQGLGKAPGTRTYRFSSQYGRQPLTDAITLSTTCRNSGVGRLPGLFNLTHPGRGRGKYADSPVYLPCDQPCLLPQQPIGREP